MADSLDVEYERTEASGGDRESKIGALMYALNSILSKEDLKKKSSLMAENVKGLQKLYILNDYLEVEYGYRIHELDQFALDKLNTIMSLDAKAFDALIETVKSLSIALEHNESPERDNRGSLRS